MSTHARRRTDAPRDVGPVLWLAPALAVLYVAAVVALVRLAAFVTRHLHWVTP